ncbi:MAG: hypothetical protein MZU79_00735 [Anaerotruncus sp.]|nr:hypothetical protein [Anaerotruncus sp.]
MHVGVVDGAGRGARSRRRCAAAPRHRRAVPVPREPRRRARCATGEVAGGRRCAGAPPTYRFDPTRPESRLARAARSTTRCSAPPGGPTAFAAGEQRLDVRRARATSTGSIPGLLGMNIMGTGHVGHRLLRSCARASQQAAEAPGRHADAPRRDYLLAQMLARLVFLGRRGRRRCSASPRWSSRCRCAARCCALARRARCSARWRSRGLGLLVASRARRRSRRSSGWMNLVMLPMWVLSGVFFSSAHFPAATQPFDPRAAADRAERRPARRHAGRRLRSPRSAANWPSSARGPSGASLSR